MACYMGCRGCCAKLRWLIFIISLLAATALLIAGLIKTVPEFRVLFQCTTRDNAIAASGSCWQKFWGTSALWFVLTCIGAGCLLISVLTCCCFCCAKGPKRPEKGQFIQGGADHYDTHAAADQYGNYNAAGPAKV